MQNSTRFDMHQKHMIRFSGIVHTIYHFCGNRNCRIAKINRCTQNIIQLFRILINAFYPTILIRDTNCNSSAISICKSTECIRQVFRFDHYALPIEYLLLIHSEHLLNGHSVSPALPRFYKHHRGMNALRCVHAPDYTSFLSGIEETIVISQVRAFMLCFIRY